MHARWLSFVIWALLAASLAYWSLTLMSRGPAAPGQVLPAAAGGSAGDWTRVFTQEAPSAPVEAVSTRYLLLGVVAPSSGQAAGGEGVALISVDGGFARAYRVGQVVEGDVHLLELSRREVGLGRGNTVSIRLALTPVPGAPSPAMQPQPGMPPGMQQGLPPGGGQPGNMMQPPGSLPPNQTGVPLNSPSGGVPMNQGSPLSVGGALPTGMQIPPDNAVTH